jgi:hypothetical protein
MHDDGREHLLDVVFRQYPETRAAAWAEMGIAEGAWPFAVAPVDLQRILWPVLELKHGHR